MGTARPRACLCFWSSRLPSTRPWGAGLAPPGPGGAPRRTNDLDPRGEVCWACPGSMAGGMARPRPSLLRPRASRAVLPVIPEPEAPAGGTIGGHRACGG
jgi:hypothetical protein